MGLLDETLVVWATEFGRTPGYQGADGRDHHPYGFSAWMAGGGIKGGIAHGATDQLGFHAVEDRHYVTDIHATVLHQLGLDPRRLEIPGHKRLEIDYWRRSGRSWRDRRIVPGPSDRAGLGERAGTVDLGASQARSLRPGHRGRPAILAGGFDRSSSRRAVGPRRIGHGSQDS